MARARNIKPGFFKNEDLAELSAEVRLLFIGLWTLADREGRMEDRPKRIKGELFPYDTSDVDSMLSQLQTSNFVVRYEVDGSRFLQVVNFVKHQDPHYKERASEIPPPPGASNFIEATGVTRETRARIMTRDGFRCVSCSAEDYLSIDHVVPASRGGSGEDDNLQVLCLKCNRQKGNRLDGEEKGARRSKHDDTSLQTRINVASTLDQGKTKLPGPVPLIPDSLIPDSLNLIPDSGSRIHSDPDGSGVPPQISAGVEPKALTAKDRVWLLGPPLLGDTPTTRALLGKLAKTYTDEVLARVLAEATADRPIEPKAWIVAACSAAPKANGHSQPDMLADPTPDWATRAGFDSRFLAENAGCGPGNAHKFSAGRRTAA